MLMITCPYGLTSILNNELKKLWYLTKDSFDTGTFVDAGLDDSYKINIRSRIANKVFLKLNKPGICLDFDELYDLTQSISRSDYIAPGHWVSIKVHTRQSNIDSPKSAQSIIQKAIMTQLTWEKDKERHIDRWWHTHTVFMVINKNICSLYINTSGKSLHERWYRDQTWDAPLKENIAAALVQLANRKYSEPLMDPFCGSGTICIEAAMIARNIAPGLNRYFACEQFPIFDKDKFDALIADAKTKSYDKQYTIIWSDIDQDVLRVAKENAAHVWVDDTISFVYGDMLDHTSRSTPLSGASNTLVTNPPYGKRMGTDVSDIHHTLSQLQTKKSVILSWYEWWKNIFSNGERSWKVTKNGADETNIFISK